jgi:hypothetical protein
MELIEGEKGYLAGIIDGEGAIYIVDKPNFNLYIEIDNTNELLMTWLGEKLGERVYPRNPIKKTLEGYLVKKQFGIRISGDEAKELLKLIYPYLIIKKGHADVALSFPVHTKKLGMSRSMSEKERLQQALCYLRMKKLNERGQQS